jgi:hypothetical protein
MGFIMYRFVIVYLIMLFLPFVQPLKAQQDSSGYKVNWVSGVVQKIKTGPENSLVTIIFQWDKEFDFASSNNLIEGIQLGDSIQVKIVGGWAQSVSKLDKPIKVKIRKPGEPQWISGEVIKIVSDQQASLVHVKMSDNKIFKVAAKNEIIKDVHESENVVFKVVKGWAVNVDKK